MPLTKKQITECWYFGYEIKNDTDDLAHIIDGINNQSCTIIEKDTRKQQESNLAYLADNFSRVDDKKSGASIKEVEKELAPDV